MAPTLDAIRNCLEGAVPSAIATCAPDGIPNVAYLSQVHYVDSEHVALSFQFFNKTRQNVLANPRAAVQVIDPDSAAHYRLTLQYLRTETAGPLFEYMKAKLASIASHTGMSKVFRLQGSDVYRVLAIEAVAGDYLAYAPPPRSVLAALRHFSRRLTDELELGGVFDKVLFNLEQLFDIRHAMVLVYDEPGRRLYTVASRGFAQSGVGSEMPLGQGVIGVAAAQRTPIRITHMVHEVAYSHAVRDAMASVDATFGLETAIPLPGLPEARSQLAVPIVLDKRLLGVLYAESPEALRFTFEDEDALVTIADQVALAMHVAERDAETAEAATSATPAPAKVSGAAATVRHYSADDSVFIDQDYLIKGVAGAIFWKLLRDYTTSQRTEFSNRELRVDPTIRLPDICDNLEARLILLQRRLAERCDFMRIEKTGRGRFRLHIGRPLHLTEVAAG